MQNYYKQRKDTTVNAKNITIPAKLKRAKALKLKWLLILKNHQGIYEQEVTGKIIWKEKILLAVLLLFHQVILAQ